MAAVTVNAAPDLVFDMETGEARPAEKKLDQIAEGDEDAE